MIVVVLMKKKEDPYSKLKKADPKNMKDNSYLLMYLMPSSHVASFCYQSMFAITDNIASL